MKKHLLLIICIVMSMPLFAQKNTNDYRYYLQKVVSSDELESVEYTYNTNYQVFTVVDRPYNFDMTTDTMFYNELNQLVKITTHQLMNDEWHYAFYVDYTYNERGLRETRKNYNNFGGSFQLGGTYTYYYNDNDQMSNWELDFAGGLYQTCDFTYNEDNLLIQEMGYNHMSGSQQNEWKVDYNYDNQGNRLSAYTYFWNGFWEEYSRDIMEYDENGNCTKFESFTGSMITERHEYEYDATPVENVAFPIDPEVDTPIYATSHNAPLVDKYYTIDTENVLQYVCDYIYFYEEIINGIGENAVSTVICPNPAEDRFIIKDNNVEQVEIYDLTGKLMYSSNVACDVTVDVSNYTSGIYVVKMIKGEKIETVKLVVK